MKRDERFSRLIKITEVLFESKLVKLRSTANAMSETEACIEALSRPDMKIEYGNEVVGALSQLQYKRWADARRYELNLTLAAQKADWLDASDDARKAFGKKVALTKIGS